MDVTPQNTKPPGRKFLSGRWLPDWLFPGQSLLSRQPLLRGGFLTAEDFARLQFVQAPFCDHCGQPYDSPEHAGMICAACLASPPLYGRARSAFVYNDASAQMVLSLKRQGRRAALVWYGQLMASAGAELLSGADLIIPVPLHYRRLASRGFNQAGWLASAVSQQVGIPVSLMALRRRKASPSQGRLSPLQRQRNVAGAFDIRHGYADRLSGKRVVLVDDVLTTGATLQACVRALRKGRVQNVDVLTLARVVAPKNPLI